MEARRLLGYFLLSCALREILAGCDCGAVGDRSENRQGVTKQLHCDFMRMFTDDYRRCEGAQKLVLFKVEDSNFANRSFESLLPQLRIIQATLNQDECQALCTNPSVLNGRIILKGSCASCNSRQTPPSPWRAHEKAPVRVQLSEGRRTLAPVLVQPPRPTPAHIWVQPPRAPQIPPTPAPVLVQFAVIRKVENNTLDALEWVLGKTSNLGAIQRVVVQDSEPIPTPPTPPTPEITSTTVRTAPQIRPAPAHARYAVMTKVEDETPDNVEWSMRRNTSTLDAVHQRVMQERAPIPSPPDIESTTPARTTPPRIPPTFATTTTVTPRPARTSTATATLPRMPPTSATPRPARTSTTMTTSQKAPTSTQRRAPISSRSTLPPTAPTLPLRVAPITSTTAAPATTAPQPAGAPSAVRVHRRFATTTTAQKLNSGDKVLETKRKQNGRTLRMDAAHTTSSPQAIIIPSPGLRISVDELGKITFVVCISVLAALVICACICYGICAIYCLRRHCRRSSSERVNSDGGAIEMPSIRARLSTDL